MSIQSKLNSPPGPVEQSNLRRMHSDGFGEHFTNELQRFRAGHPVKPDDVTILSRYGLLSSEDLAHHAERQLGEKWGLHIQRTDELVAGFVTAARSQGLSAPDALQFRGVIIRTNSPDSAIRGFEELPIDPAVKAALRAPWSALCLHVMGDNHIRAITLPASLHEALDNRYQSSFASRVALSSGERSVHERIRATNLIHEML